MNRIGYAIGRGIGIALAFLLWPFTSQDQRDRLASWVEHDN